jgi:hypothetical protein
VSEPDSKPDTNTYSDSHTYSNSDGNSNTLRTTAYNAIANSDSNGYGYSRTYHDTFTDPNLRTRLLVSRAQHPSRRRRPRRRRLLPSQRTLLRHGRAQR